VFLSQEKGSSAIETGARTPFNLAQIDSIRMNELATMVIITDCGFVVQCLKVLRTDGLIASSNFKGN
jgi:hypothetical protein